VLSLRNLKHTGPWFWHGNEKDLETALSKSLSGTMLGKQPDKEVAQALQAFLETLTYPANPHRRPDGSLSDAARRGEQVFQGEKAGCARCHPSPYFTDGRIHNVGTGDHTDVYKGYNPPSLLGVHD